MDLCNCMMRESFLLPCLSSHRCLRAKMLLALLHLILIRPILVFCFTLKFYVNLISFSTPRAGLIHGFEGTTARSAPSPLCPTPIKWRKLFITLKYLFLKIQTFKKIWGFGVGQKCQRVLAEENLRIKM